MNTLVLPWLRTALVWAAVLCTPYVAVAQTGTVQGVVIEAGIDEPMPGVNVFLSGTTLGTATGADGRFIIDNVPAGPYRLEARLLGYEPVGRMIDVTAGRVLAVTLSLQEQPIDIPEIVVERVMLTGGRRGVHAVPGSAQYIGPRELDRYSYNDIQRVLRDVPGVNIQEEDGYGLRPNIGMRGTGSERSSKITVMEDGVLMAPAPYAAPAAYYFPTTGRMQGVEVRKGSSQIKYGPYTTGGALNLISTQIPTAFGVRAEVLGGRDNDRTLHASVGHAFPNVGFLVETYQARTDGFKNLESGGNTGFDKKDYLAKLRFNTRSSASVYQALTFKIGRSNETSNETYLGLTDTDFQQTPTLRYAGSQSDVMETQHRQYVARHVIRPAPFLDVTTTLYRTEFERDWFKLDRVRASEDGARVKIGAVLADPATFSEEYAILRGQTTSHDDALEVKHNNRTYYAQGIQSVVGLRWKSERLAHDVELGIRYHEDQIDRFQWVDLFEMDHGVMGLTAPGRPGTESNRIEQAAALAVHAQYRLVVGRWTATPGLRYENIAIERLDYGVDDPARTGADLAQRENHVTAFIPGIALDYAATKQFKVFGGVHRGFAPPGSKEGTRPEQSVNYEVGARYHAGVFYTQGVFFFNDYSNLLGADLAAGGGEGTTDQFNGGAVQAVGFEYTLHHDFGALTSANLSMPVRLAYTFTRATFQNAFDSTFEPWGSVTEGDELPYVPGHQLSFGVGLQTLRFGVDLSAKYVGRMRTAVGRGVLIDHQSTDAHFVLDAAADLRLVRQVRLFASIRNLTDAAYIVARRPAGVRPGLPRLLLLGIKAAF